MMLKQDWDEIFGRGVLIDVYGHYVAVSLGMENGRSPIDAHVRNLDQVRLL